MQANPILPFISSGRFCIKVSTNMTLTFKGVAGGGGGAGNASGDTANGGQGSRGTAVFVFVSAP